jgi:N-acetylmuramoyl-L-alanine amidase
MIGVRARGLVLWLVLLGSSSAPGVPGAAPPPGMVPFEITVVPPGRDPTRGIVAWERDGSLYLGANEISALLGWTKFWRPDLGRLILAGAQHRITVIEGTDVALVDEGRMVHLPGAVFLWEGQMLLPLDLFLDEHGEPRPWTETPLAFSRETRRLRLGGEKPSLSDVRISSQSGGWVLRLASTSRLQYDVVSRDRSEFVLRLSDVTYDPLLLPVPAEHPWFQGLRLESGGGGIDVRFTPGPGATGYHVTLRDTSTVEILLGLLPEEESGTALDAFGESGAQLGRIGRVVLDPGHGGKDSGDTAPGGKEAELTWKLAEHLRNQLEGTLGVEVVLTREKDTNPSPERRADLANRSGADLFLSLHVHARAGGPEGFIVSEEGPAGAIPGTLGDLGFRPFGAARGAFEAESRVVALALLEAVAEVQSVPARGVRVESIPELAGVSMPGVLLELGSNPGEKWTESRLEAVAGAIVQGIERAPSLAEEGR